MDYCQYDLARSSLPRSTKLSVRKVGTKGSKAKTVSRPSSLPPLSPSVARSVNSSFLTAASSPHVDARGITAAASAMGYDIVVASPSDGSGPVMYYQGPTASLGYEFMNDYAMATMSSNTGDYHSSLLALPSSSLETRGWGDQLPGSSLGSEAIYGCVVPTANSGTGDYNSNMVAVPVTPPTLSLENRGWNGKTPPQESSRVSSSHQRISFGSNVRPVSPLWRRSKDLLQHGSPQEDVIHGEAKRPPRKAAIVRPREQKKEEEKLSLSFAQKRQPDAFSPEDEEKSACSVASLLDDFAEDIHVEEVAEGYDSSASDYKIPLYSDDNETDAREQASTCGGENETNALSFGSSSGRDGHRAFSRESLAAVAPRRDKEKDTTLIRSGHSAMWGTY